MGFFHSELTKSLAGAPVLCSFYEASADTNTHASFVAVKDWLTKYPATPVSIYHLPDTGQTKCYNNTAEIVCPQPGQPFYGQDANYNSINQPSYLNNNNGTVTDNVTGLMWQQASDSTTRTWDAANAYCAALPLAGGCRPGMS